MHAALKLQCGRVTGNKKFIIGGLTKIASSYIPMDVGVITLPMKYMFKLSLMITIIQLQMRVQFHKDVLKIWCRIRGASCH